MRRIFRLLPPQLVRLIYFGGLLGLLSLLFVWVVVIIQGPKLDPVIPAQDCPQKMPKFNDYGEKFISLPSPPTEEIRIFFTSKVAALNFWEKNYTAFSFSLPPPPEGRIVRYPLVKRHFVKTFDLLEYYLREMQPSIQNFAIASELSVSCSAKFFAEINSTKFVVKIHPKFTEDEQDFSFLARTRRIMNGFAVNYALSLPQISLPFRFGNEELSHALDLLVGFNRTPPAYFLPLHSSFVKSSVASVVQKEKLRHCQINYTEWKESISVGDNSQGTMLISTAIQFVPGVKEIYLGKILNFAHSWNPFYRGREIGTRLFFDFLVGNIDRLNVNHFSKESESGDQVLLYMDQNSLLYDQLHGWDYLEYVVNLMSSICKFYHDPIENLRKLTKEKRLDLELVEKTLNLNPHMTPFFEAYGIDFQKFLSDLPFTEGINRRAASALRVVDECVARKGADFVFCDGDR